MKKVLVLCIAALSLLAVSCKEDDQSGIDWSKVTVDGFYVAGEATGSAEIKPECVMAAGYNEVEKAVRDGMYEKYIVLEGGKDFYLAYSDGGKLTYYSAKLAEFVTPEEEAYSDNPAKVLKGELIIGETPVAMKVEKTGLYHIVLDVNKNKDLKNAQIVLLDASDFGVRGGMNSWGFTASDPKPETFSNAGTTFTFKNQTLAKNGEFKFATGNYWKVTLDDAGKVKAEVSLAEGMTLNGGNIKVEKGGLYDITLTFKLAQGSFDKNFSYTAVCTQESSAPEHMYMNGGQWGGSTWDWASDGIVELSGIPSAPGYFWCTRWFDHTQEFKFCAVKAWNGDFGDNGSNCKVAEDGFYTVFVNGNDNTVQIMPAEVYGIGDAWGADAWDFNAPDAVKFVADGQVMKATVVNNSSAVRLASKVTPTAAIDGVTTPNGWIDWWKTEFVYFDGKIAYRGAGGDQDRVAVEAGKEITLDFNAGTVTVGEPFVPAVTIDGNFDDWAEVAGAEPADAFKAFKVNNDAKNFYFYIETDPGSRLWSGGAYLYLYFDFDNNLTTGAYSGKTGMGANLYEAYAFMYLFKGSADAPAIATTAGDDAVAEGMTTNNVVIASNNPATSSDIVKMEILIPRANFTNQVNAGDVIGVGSYRSKDGGNIHLAGYTVK